MGARGKSLQELFEGGLVLTKALYILFVFAQLCMEVK